MSALGIGISTQEKTTGWEAIGISGHRPMDPLMVLSLRAYRLAGRMIDDCSDNSDIREMLDLAKELGDLAYADAECGCVLPEQSCRVCRAIARMAYSEEV